MPTSGVTNEEAAAEGLYRLKVEFIGPQQAGCENAKPERCIRDVGNRPPFRESWQDRDIIDLRSPSPPSHQAVHTLGHSHRAGILENRTVHPHHRRSSKALLRKEYHARTSQATHNPMPPRLVPASVTEGWRNVPDVCPIKVPAARPGPGHTVPMDLLDCCLAYRLRIEPHHFMFLKRKLFLARALCLPQVFTKEVAQLWLRVHGVRFDPIAEYLWEAYDSVAWFRAELYRVGTKESAGDV
ncbi:hypothetical protein LTR56_024278 [Elasticomyces elasticus]|nr:hypothetical protein LTR22_028458 [Elasticomyces elasticus]KAK3619023.1 hypothetical protein LTR56_024278 [Elasticomyces elasticus]KAK4905904.1 hypothetical protein LTR49_024874 [Elasticomyces elasticus]